MPPSRRHFLQLLGAGALAAPALTLLRSRRAGADVAGRPARMLILYTPHGAPAEYFWPQSATNYNSAGGDVSILAPLQPFASKLNVIRGVDYVGSNNHYANRDVLTNKTADSVDTVVARALGVSPLRLGVVPDYPGSFTVDGYLAFDGGSPQQHNPNPAAVFDDIVGALPTDGGGDPTPPAGPSRAELRALALGAPQGDLQELRTRVQASSMRARVAAHLEAVNGLRDVAPTGGGGEPGTPIAGCSATGLPSVEAVRGRNVFAAENFDDLMTAQLDVAELALRCGVTRVVSIQAGFVNHGIPFTWIGETAGHHQLSHSSAGSLTRIGHARCQHYFAQKLAGLLTRLDVTDPEDPAHTILDNTVVLWTSEIADGQAHNCESVPIVLGGGGSGYLQTGQYLQLGSRSHAEILLAMCGAMNVTGNFGPGHAPMAEVVA